MCIPKAKNLGLKTINNYYLKFVWPNKNGTCYPKRMLLIFIKTQTSITTVAFGGVNK